MCREPPAPGTSTGEASGALTLRGRRVAARKSCLGTSAVTRRALGRSSPRLLPNEGGELVGRVGVREVEAKGLGLNRHRVFKETWG